MTHDNHDGVITHLEPDILECEVKWALGSITMNKASGHDGISIELFQILKDDAVKVLQTPRNSHKKSRRGSCGRIQVKKMHKIGSEQLCLLVDLISSESRN